MSNSKLIIATIRMSPFWAFKNNGLILVICSRPSFSGYSKIYDFRFRDCRALSSFEPRAKLPPQMPSIFPLTTAESLRCRSYPNVRLRLRSPPSSVPSRSLTIQNCLTIQNSLTKYKISQCHVEARKGK